MFAQHIKGLAVLAGLAAIAGGASAAKADFIGTRTFNITKVGISLDYGSFNYTAPDGSTASSVGLPITNAHVKIDYQPGAGVDPTQLVIALVVPVTDAPSEFLEILGTDLTLTAPNTYSIEYDSTNYNGIVRSGRYSLETYTLDPEGNPIGTPGAFIDSAITFSVAVPEPTAALALLPAAGLIARRRR